MVWSCSVHAPCGLILFVLSVLWKSSVEGSVLLQELENADRPEPCGFDPTFITSECYTSQDDGSLSRTLVDPGLEDTTILPELTLCKSTPGNQVDFFICEGGHWKGLDPVAVHREKRWTLQRQNRGPRCPSGYTTISNGRTRCRPTNNPTLCCYYCDEGYELVGQRTVACRNNVWRAPKPVCQVRPAPPVTVRCAAGSYSTRDGTCELCAQGYYQDEKDMTSCIQCPDNKTTDFPGAASVDECYDNVDVSPV